MYTNCQIVSICIILKVLKAEEKMFLRSIPRNEASDVTMEREIEQKGKRKRENAWEETLREGQPNP